MNTIEQIIVEILDELHYEQYPSENKAPVYKIQELEGDYFPLYVTKETTIRFSDQQTADLTERLAITEANLSREKKMFERVLAEKEEAIAGLKGVLLRIKNGDYVAVDAESALIEIDNIIQQSITKLNINEDDQK